ncbi:ribosome hibernation-promoting factor, HPF/YfiA family [Alkaliphilus sp. B6464]|uniref:ribosome hibernation-promoting factor, HPF/YfiA family n=1 Tax=Alkaliphilus sp. B6464 TaxID=2731219 RepID=UPI001BADD9F5|nr:ribosome-associated translation inhibitor RaiA [Alkaliphilus sp. B6464]QUH22179.1 ribosome-associated translation inhibitor RaiA [Alkaliphilus sp. B6464]
MNIKIFSKGMPITQGLKNAIYKKLDKLNEKYLHNRDTINVTVTMKKEHDKHICELLVFAPKHTFKKESSSDDMYVSINKVFDIMDRELRQHKEKLITRRFNDEDINCEEEIETELENECDCDESCGDNCKCR